MAMAFYSGFVPGPQIGYIHKEWVMLFGLVTSSVQRFHLVLNLCEKNFQNLSRLLSLWQLRFFAVWRLLITTSGIGLLWP